MTTRLSLRIDHLERSDDFPQDDDALGTALWRRLRAQLPRGVPRPLLLVLFERSVQVVDLPPILRSGQDVHRACSAFASQPGAEALAAVGVMTRRRREEVLGQFAVAFVEWPDGRWWCCTRPLDPLGRPVERSEDDVQRAIDGAAKPGGLGAWFRRARYEQLTLRIEAPDVN
jgi:hypothetical protein